MLEYVTSESPLREMPQNQVPQEYAEKDKTSWQK